MSGIREVIAATGIVASLASSALAGEPTGPAAAALAGWFRTSPAIKCVSPDGRDRRCVPTVDTVFDIRISPSGDRAIAWTTWLPDPTGSAPATTAAIFERRQGAWGLVRDVPEAGGMPVGDLTWQDGSVRYTAPVHRPGDDRLGASGRETRMVSFAPTPLSSPAKVQRAAVPTEEPNGWPWTHNGSTVAVDQDAGTIAYQKPRSGLASVVRPGTVLFRGRLGYSGQGAVGTAYAYKEGCEPAPYAVRGGYDRSNETLMLVGAGPVRQGCAVVGYSPTSPHAKLVFKNIIQD